MAKNPVRVAIVCNSLPPYRIHVHRRIVREMPEVELWTLCTHEASGDRWKHNPPAEIRPVDIGSPQEAMGGGAMRKMKAAWRRGGLVIDWLREHKARAVVVNGYNDPGRLRVILWCRGQGIPCFIFADSNIHGDRVTGLKALFKRQLVSWVVRNSAGLLPCGELGKQYFMKYGADEGRIFFFPYEPDYALIRELPAEYIEQTRKRFGLACGRRRIVFSGRLIPVKRADLLVDAFVAIADQRPDWDLLMIGDGVLRKELEARLPERLRGRVVWTGFLDDQAAVSAMYRLSDVLVLPSDYEPWALVVNEAAAAGMAVVASTVIGAAAELVRDGVNGRIFVSGSVQSLMECLLETTSPERVDVLKAGSAGVLRDWQERGDPLAGLRKALSFSRLLK